MQKDFLNIFTAMLTFFFKGTKLYVPKSSMRKLFAKEARNGGLMEYFGIQKTLDILHDHFF